MDIIIDEDAAIEDMRKKIKTHDEQQTVDRVLQPYMRGGTVATFNNKKQRYIIRIPRALQKKTGGQEKFTAVSKADVYHKVYQQLCGQPQTLETIFEAAMAERDAVHIVTDGTQSRCWQLWRKWLRNSPLTARPIADIKASELIAFLQQISAGCTMGRTTYTDVKGLLHMAYDYAVAHDIVPANLARACRPKVKFKPTKGGTYTDDERKAAMQYIEQAHKTDDSIYYLAIYVMFCLCCRIGELKALRWNDYHPNEQTLYIHAEVVPRNGQPTYIDHTKESERGNRTQYLPLKVSEMLNSFRPVNAKGDDLIFPAAEGGYLNTNKFNNKLAIVCKHAGIPYHSSHKIRFWAVTAMARKTGGDITAVGRYAGHCCTQTTLHYIRQAQDEDVQRAAAAEVFST